MDLEVKVELVLRRVKVLGRLLLGCIALRLVVLMYEGCFYGGDKWELVRLFPVVRLTSAEGAKDPTTVSFHSFINKVTFSFSSHSKQKYWATSLKGISTQNCNSRRIPNLNADDQSPRFFCFSTLALSEHIWPVLRNKNILTELTVNFSKDIKQNQEQPGDTIILYLGIQYIKDGMEKWVYREIDSKITDHLSFETSMVLTDMLQDVPALDLSFKDKSIRFLTDLFVVREILRLMGIVLILSSLLSEILRLTCSFVSRLVRSVLRNLKTKAKAEKSQKFKGNNEGDFKELNRHMDTSEVRETNKSLIEEFSWCFEDGIPASHIGDLNK